MDKVTQVQVANELLSHLNQANQLLNIIRKEKSELNLVTDLSDHMFDAWEVAGDLRDKLREELDV